ncbi:MAG: hypothetical protein II345_03080, partial [Alistipes sp.]|nr:hypothetical protein [Alistipes sp.]
MQFRKLIVLLVTLGCVACQAVDIDPVGVETPTHREVVLRAMQPASTRTALGDGDGAAGSAQEIRWTEGDRLSVWARKSGASAYQFEAATFQLSTFNATFQSADFLATIPTMP